MLSNYEERINKRLQENAKIVLKYFLKYKLTPFEIAKFTGIPEEIVINILHDNALIQDVMPNCIISDIENILAYQSRNIKLCFLPVVLNLFSGKEKWQFLAMLILTFRLHLPELSEILRIDAEELYQTLEKYNPHLQKALQYLFTFDNYPQDVANQRLINYISEYYEAYQHKDKARIKELLMYINDADYVELLLDYHQEILNNDQLLILLNHQIKYALRVFDVVEPLNISKTKYADPVKFFIADKIDLQKELINLAKYNQNSHKYKRGNYE